MGLTLDQVRSTLRRVARDGSGQVEELSVAAIAGGTERVELLVRFSGCHEGPCVLLLNLTRSDVASLEQELKAQLHSTLRFGEGHP